MRQGIIYNLALIPGVIGVLAGCAGSIQDPCDLLATAEVRTVDNSAVSAQWVPDSKDGSNELCVYSDAQGERRFMLFYWHDRNMSPRQLLEEALPGSEGRVIQVESVGDEAMAGFQASNDGAVLKLLAARAQSGTIGIRVRKPVRATDREYEDLQELARKALSRME